MATEVAGVPERFVPPELAQLRQWVIWRREMVGGRQTKVPYRAAQPTVKASSTDSTSWSTLEDALTACEQPGVDGIGFVVTKDGGLTFVDLDHAADDDGRAKPWARDILRQLNSYTELSPSGTGYHVLVRGSIPGPRCRTSHEDGVVELYDNARYFTFLGRPYAGYEAIQDRQAELDELYRRLFQPEPAAGHVAPVLPLPVNLGDQELLERAMGARNGHRFRALWEGDLSAYSSHSEADLALSGMLAFWAGGDAGRIDGLFRQSGLMRGKWDERHGQRTYGQVTVDKALEGKTEFYQPESRAGGGIRHGSTGEEIVVPIVRSDTWPVPPKDDAFYGLPSEVVWTVDPYTEADPIAVLGQFLALFGVAVGTRSYFEVGATRHTPRLFVGIVGRSAKARKGDSWAPVERLMCEADSTLRARILGGFGSGEAMVHAVRDARYAEKDGRQVRVDGGEKDKRLMVLETELARLLVSVGREGSTISQIVRDAYDGRPLRNLVKSSPASATEHHVGIIGHSTAEELRGRLSEDQIRNGFANRFIWLAVQRSKKLASPPRFAGDHLDALLDRIRERRRDASMVTSMRRSTEAADLWEHWYEELSKDGKGILGVLTERAEAHVLRLSMVYALTDGTDVIEVPHLRAARALWEYGERSVSLIFGGTTGSTIADRILEVLADGPMTRKEMVDDAFSGSISGETLHRALLLLEDRMLARREKMMPGPKGGRPAERWIRA